MRLCAPLDLRYQAAAMSAYRFLPCLIVVSAALTGCSGSDDRPVEIAVPGPSAAAFTTGPNLPYAAQLLRGATIEGLVAFDGQGRVGPALADRWIVTDDGLSFIFRLRDGTWADGSPITGDSARTALLKAIAAQRGTPLGQDLAVISEIRAMAGRVVEINLASKQPEFLQVLAQPELGLVWAQRGAGPMRLRREKDSALLRPMPPEDRGMPQDERWQQRARRVELVSLPAATAIDRFNAGDFDVVTGGTLADFPRLDEKGVARAAIRVDPVGGLFGLVAAHDDGFLAKPENREALAMAIDRTALAGSINLSGWVTTTRVVNPGLAGDNGSIGERWASRTQEERRALAASRVAAWKSASGAPLVLRLALPGGPGGDILANRLTQDFAAVGIQARRVSASADSDLRLIDMVASYGSAQWFFNRLSCTSLPAGCSPAADALAEQARLEPDPTRHAELLSQAEAQITLANSYIPLGLPIRWSLVGGAVVGFDQNRFAVHPLMSFAVLPR